MADQIGRVVGGRYRLLAPVGTGASADVYVADDVTLRRRVAVKVLHEALAGDEGFLRRFRAEARAVASLRHPNIMAVFDWGEEEDGPFLVLEYLGGGSLRDLLDRGSRLSLSQAVLVGLEAARGLDYAHRRGLVHRDVKPGNLLFDDEGRLAIADFGIARALAEATWTEPAGAVVGTVRYASPEQARGLTLDGRADVYALALVLVEAVTGRVPFAADTTIATLMARLDRPIPGDATLGPLAPVIEGAGTLDPGDRSDAAEVVRALEGAARQLPRPDPLALSPVARLPLPEHEDHTTVFAPAGNGGGRGTPPAMAAPPAPATPATGTPAAATPTTGTPATADPATAALAAATVAAAHRTPLPAEQQPARRRRPPWWVAAIVAVVAAVLAAVLLLVRPAMRPAYAVPDLHDQAVGTLVAHPPAHFRIRVQQVRRLGVADRVVLSQDPAPPAKRRAGTVITVVEAIGNPLVSVPNLASQSVDQADAALAARDLTPGAPLYQFSTTVPAGTIIDWSPKGDVEEKSTVSLVASKGAEFVTVPDLASTPDTPVTVAQATAALNDLGIQSSQIAQTQDYNDKVPAGDVIGTTPAAGGQADRAQPTAVTLDVSKGPQVVAVPDVRGQSVRKATDILQQAGLTVSAVYGPPGANTVVDQRPAPGTKVKLGSGVQLLAF